MRHSFGTMDLPMTVIRRTTFHTALATVLALAFTMQGANAASPNVGGAIRESAARISLVQKASHHPPHRRCLLDKWNRRYPHVRLQLCENKNYPGKYYHCDYPCGRFDWKSIFSSPYR